MDPNDIWLQIVVPGDPRILSVIRAAVGELASVAGLPENDSGAVKLAVDEALTNVIRHAYQGIFGQPIEIECRLSSDRLEFIVLDRGEAPDPVRLKPHPLDDEALGGRGTHIIRSVMDEVCYDRLPGANRLRLGKRLPPAQAGPGVEGNNV